MSVYNGEKFVKQAIESVLHQTFEEFEFLIINDASTDASEVLIKSFNDPRIRYYRNDKNIGLTKSLNRGLKLSHGVYIARMDADDVSVPDRLCKQKEFLDQNENFGLVGSWFQLTDSVHVVQVPLDPERIKIELLFKNPIAHPTVMMKREAIEKYNLYYNEELTTSQDHELWYRFSKHTLLANIPEALVYYRRHEDQISNARKTVQLENSNLIRKLKIEDFLGEEVQGDLIDGLNKLLANDAIDSANFACLVSLLNQVQQRNQEIEVYQPQKLHAYLNYLLKKGMNSLEKIDKRSVKAYLSSTGKSLNDIYFLSTQIKKMF